MVVENAAVAGFDTWVRDLSMTDLAELDGSYVLAEVSVNEVEKSDGEFITVGHAKVYDADTGEWIGDLHSRGIFVVRDFQRILAGGYNGERVGPVRVVKEGNANRFRVAR